MNQVNARREIIREWRSLPKELRQTDEQAAAFAMQVKDKYKFSSDSADPSPAVIAGLDEVQVPALYVVGDRDGVYRSPNWNHLIPSLKQFVPLLRETIVLKGCGHWTQQERAKDVNNALLEFLKQN